MAKPVAAVVGLSVAALIVGLGAFAARPAAQASPEDLQQLVAPVALYPDELLAEVLGASTYPADVDEAAQWLQANASLSSDAVASAVDSMPWDDSVKALTEFPLVLADMDRNLSWTSALGDAYYNQPDDVMDAVQALRRRAMAAGTLQSNSQVTVTDRDGIIAIEPAEADTVYVPDYDCWTDFGQPISPYPEFIFAPGFVGGPRVVWSAGFRIGGAWGRVNWGWHNWAFDWGNRRVVFRRTDYVSHSPTIVDRHYPPRSGAPPGRGDVGPRTGRPATPPPPLAGQRGPGRSTEPPPAAAKPPVGARPAPPNSDQSRKDRGFPSAKPSPPPTGTHSGAMSGIGQGGAASQNSSRGRSSMGAPDRGRSSGPPPTPPGRSAGPPRSAPPPARSSAPPDNGRGRGRGGL